jgi:hypothetical protein
MSLRFPLQRTNLRLIAYSKSIPTTARCHFSFNSTLSIFDPPPLPPAALMYLDRLAGAASRLGCSQGALSRIILPFDVYVHDDTLVSLTCIPVQAHSLLPWVGA